MSATILPWVQWGTTPEWLAAIGTVGGLFYALLLYRRESKARHLLEEDRLRDQARFVAAWINEEGTLTLRNGANEPVYDAVICHSREEGFDRGERLPILHQMAILPPLAVVDTKVEVPHPMGTTMFRLAFTDARGLRWVREGGGALIRISPGLDVTRVGASAAIREEAGDYLHVPHYPG